MIRAFVACIALRTLRAADVSIGASLLRADRFTAQLDNRLASRFHRLQSRSVH